MIWIGGYGCTTAAGAGVERLWQGVRSAVDHSRPVTGALIGGVAQAEGLRACLWPQRKFPEQRLEIGRQLQLAWREAKSRCDGFILSLLRDRPLGVILASTKGFVDDLVWEDSGASDALSPLLDDFLKVAELSPVRQVTVSNACSSSLSAFWLAEKWLARGTVENVIVIAADAIGSFVLRGFSTLRALSQSTVRPFASDRDGLQLGEAAAAFILTARRPHQDGIGISGTGIDAEGFAVTRPSPMGESLERAIRQASAGEARTPQLIIAHGTATSLNDEVEDRVFASLYGTIGTFVTGSKWSVGHCLGAGGAVDAVLACEAMRRGEAFGLENTRKVDASFRARYLLSGSDCRIGPIRQVLVASLGFGGVHAACFFERAVS